MEIGRALSMGLALFGAASLFFTHGPSFGQADGPFVPTGFKVPEQFENEHFRIKPLTPEYTERDYEAVMSSLNRLQDMFLVEWDWPQSSMTLEDDRIDLGKEKERFRARTSFAYTVLSLDDSKVLGAVYFYPANKGGFDADVTMWVRDSAFDDGLDPILFSAVKEWIAGAWPFEKVGYPGRDISWKDWNALE